MLKPEQITHKKSLSGDLSMAEYTWKHNQSDQNKLHAKAIRNAADS